MFKEFKEFEVTADYQLFTTGYRLLTTDYPLPTLCPSYTDPIPILGTKIRNPTEIQLYSKDNPYLFKYGLSLGYPWVIYGLSMGYPKMGCDLA